MPLVIAARHGQVDGSSYWHLLGSLGPALDAVAARTMESGTSSMADLAFAALRWRGSWRWHAVAWGGPVLLYLRGRRHRPCGAVLVRPLWL